MVRGTENGETMMSLRKNAMWFGAAAVAALSANGAAEAYTSSIEGGYASVPTSRTSITVKDTKADGNRIYANWYQNNDTIRRQIVTRAFNQSVTQALNGGNKVARFQVCVDKPWSGDSCAAYKKV